MVLQYQKHARLHFERSPSCFTCDFDSIHCVIHYIVLLLNGVGGYHQASNSHNNDEKQRAFCCRVLIIIKCHNHPSEALVLPSLLLVLWFEMMNVEKFIYYYYWSNFNFFFCSIANLLLLAIMFLFLHHDALCSTKCIAPMGQVDLFDLYYTTMYTTARRRRCIY